MTRIPNVDVWLWMCIATALLATYVYPGFVPRLDHDSFQYLSAAENALKGHLGYTSLLHYDAERAFGVIPAPIVTFPVGYGLAIALVSLTGVSMQGAALFLNAASTVACVPLLAWIAGQSGLSRVLRNVVVACFVFNGAVIKAGSVVLSEALFAFIVLLGVALLVRARLCIGTSRWWLWAGAGVAFGAAYFVRYAGLFFVLGLAFLVVRHLLASNRSLAAGHGVALAVASGAALTWMTRNILLVGNWRGRDEMLVSNPFFSALAATVRGVNALFLGSGTGTSTPGGTFILKALFSALFLAGMAWLAWSHLRQRDRQPYSRPAVRGIGIDLLLLTASYVGCMFYAGMTSSISYGSVRNFLPITPLIILMFGLALHTLLTMPPQASTPRKLSLLALASSFCFYVYLNLLVLQLPTVDQASLAAKRLDSIASNGLSARTVVLDLVGPRGVIVANNGQAVGHVLARPTVSLVGRHFSNVEWNEKAIQDAVRRFNAAAIVISIPEQQDDDNLLSAFVRQLAQGDSPSWMKLVYRSKEVLVFAPR